MKFLETFLIKIPDSISLKNLVFEIRDYANKCQEAQ